ncbi:MAG TPA: nicotinamide-nucleotide amidohydrolase family protein [Chlamydiales bacterium]|nr:nicotinamide-nucleotide amidohydrolase family protein [Chlamydiales bacterium]
MDVEIVSIGDEVLQGMTVNSNAAILSFELTKRGYTVRRHIVLPDDIEMIRAGVKEAKMRSEFVIVTGGLGPTLDDLTRKALQPFFLKKPLELKNHVGTATGVFGNGLVLLPGVPREMEAMFYKEALPLLQKHFPVTKPKFTRRCTLCLLREMEVDPWLKTMRSKEEVEIGLYPSYGSLQIVFRSSSPVDDFIEKVKERFPTFFIGDGKIEEAVHHELIARKKTLGIAESCTGGSLAARLVAIPDASLFFSGSIVAYSNAWKERFLDVKPDTLRKNGAVSRETVEEMVHGIFEKTDCDYAIAVSGMLGPKNSSLKPIGTVFIGVGKRNEPIDIGQILAPSDRIAGIELAAQTALGVLWRRIVHNTMTLDLL